MTDRSAPLRQWAMNCDALGRTWRIPALSAADWIAAYLDMNDADDFSGIFPGLVEPLHVGGEVLDLASEMFNNTYLSDDPIPVDADAIAKEILTAATGFKWWIARNLIAEATSWEAGVGGVLLLRGVDYERLSIGAVLSCAYTVIRELTGEKWPQTQAKLEKPPVGVSVTEMLDEAKASNAFMAAMATNR